MLEWMAMYVRSVDDSPRLKHGKVALHGPLKKSGCSGEWQRRVTLQGVWPLIWHTDKASERGTHLAALKGI